MMGPFEDTSELVDDADALDIDAEDAVQDDLDDAPVAEAVDDALAEDEAPADEAAEEGSDEVADEAVDETGANVINVAVPTTGDSELDSALRALAASTTAPLEEQLPLIEAAHRSLQDRLADTEG